MNDLERELRTALDREAGDAPAPHDAGTAVRRTRRRQVGTVALGALAVVAIAGAAFVGVRAIGDGGGEIVPASRTDTMNGITITYPETWTLIDPDAAGLNGPPTETTPDVPRLLLALAPFDPGALLACPGMAETPHSFLMTVQEQPLALNGDAARPWPIELEPMNVGSAESACYPGWEFHRAGWTAEGRTFEARAGFAPDVSAADRDALFDAFASMSFAPGDGGATSFIVATGTTAGEDWELVAQMQGGGLTLGLEAQSFGAAIGGFSDSAGALEMSSHRIGEGPDAQRIVFGVVRSNATRLGLVVTGETEAAMPAPEIIDIPDRLTSDFDAFVFTIGLDETAAVTAFDASGGEIGSAVIGPQDEPIGTPPQQEAPLEDGRHFGYVREVDLEERTIVFDLAIWLSGEEANQAYQEATGETGPVPNDYFVINDNPRLRTLTLAPDARVRILDWNQCCDIFFDADLEVWAEVIARQDFVEAGDRRYSPNAAQVWITVEDGVVTLVEEQYTP